MNTGEFPWQRASNADFDSFFYMDLHKLLNKQSDDQWLETTWRSCGIIVMSQPTFKWQVKVVAQPVSVN